MDSAKEKAQYCALRESRHLNVCSLAGPTGDSVHLKSCNVSGSFANSSFLSRQKVNGIPLSGTGHVVFAKDHNEAKTCLHRH